MRLVLLLRIFKILLIIFFAIFLLGLQEGLSKEHSLKQLTFSKTTHDGYPYWSPDGKYIIYSSGTGETCLTKIIPADGGNPRLLTPSFAQHARWSGDGHYVVFDSDFGTIMQLVSPNGGTPIRIDPEGIPIVKSGMPCWSPDSKSIAFISNGPIYILDLAKRKSRKVFEKEGKIAIPFDWTKDGLNLLADVRDQVNKRESDIWLIPLKEGKAKQLTFLKGRQVKPDLSPDGSMIVFCSDHGGNLDLWVMAAKGGEPVQLTFFKGNEKNPGFDIEPSWSPDGTKIAFSSTRSGYWAIWVMEPDLDSIRTKLSIR